MEVALDDVIERRLIRLPRWCGVVALVAAAAGIVAVPGVAFAHQPVYLGLTDATLTDAPTVTDGTVSVAAYATLEGGTDARALRAVFAAGDRLVVELLIPALEPERSLTVDELPVVDVVAPDGTVTSLASAIGEQFDESFTRTSYVRLAALDATAVAGTYGFVVRGSLPARITLVTGFDERGVEIADAETQGSVTEWYATPPAQLAAPATSDVTSASTMVTEPKISVADTTASSSSSTSSSSSSSSSSSVPVALASRRHIGPTVGAIALVLVLGTISFLLARRRFR
jgi:hypothetical protein